MLSGKWETDGILYDGAVIQLLLVRAQPGIVVKRFERADPSDERWERNKKRFLERARLQQTLAANSEFWATVHNIGEEGATAVYFATDRAPLTLKNVIDGQTRVSSAGLLNIVGTIVNALVELRDSSNRAHGRLHSANVLLTGSGAVDRMKVLLCDPADDATLERQPANDDDLIGIGRLLHWIGTGSNHDGVSVLPDAAWRRVGSHRKPWRELCTGLLGDGSLASRRVAQLDDLRAAFDELAAKVSVGRRLWRAVGGGVIDAAFGRSKPEPRLGSAKAVPIDAPPIAETAPSTRPEQVSPLPATPPPRPRSSPEVQATVAPPLKAPAATVRGNTTPIAAEPAPTVSALPKRKPSPPELGSLTFSSIGEPASSRAGATAKRVTAIELSPPTREQRMAMATLRMTMDRADAAAKTSDTIAARRHLADARTLVENLLADESLGDLNVGRTAARLALELPDDTLITPAYAYIDAIHTDWDTDPELLETMAKLRHSAAYSGSRAFKLSAARREAIANRLTHQPAFDAMRRAADAGDLASMAELGTMFLDGIGTPREPALAVEWLRRAANAGNAQGMIRLAHAYRDGRVGTADPRQADAWFRKAASVTSPGKIEPAAAASMTQIGEMYARGTGVPKDYAEAAKWFRKASLAGDANATNLLGVLYAHGRGVPNDYIEALALYRKAADAGDPGGMYNLANLCRNGSVEGKGDVEAVKWFRRAAELGHAESMEQLGVMFEGGYGVSPEDEETTRNFVDSLYTSGAMTGSGKSDVEAVRWFRRAAEAGDVSCITRIVDAYAQGRGVTRSEAEAIKWYAKAAEDSGAIFKQTVLAWIYAAGDGAPRDDAEAIKWLRRAARAGESVAMYGLASMFEDGHGVKKDRAEATKWYRRGATRISLIPASEPQWALDKYKAAAQTWNGRAATWGVANLVWADGWK